MIEVKFIVVVPKRDIDAQKKKNGTIHNFFYNSFV